MDVVEPFAVHAKAGVLSTAQQRAWRVDEGVAAATALPVIKAASSRSLLVR